MPDKNNRYYLFLLFMFVCFSISTLNAQEGNRIIPTLNSHEFVPITGASTPFINTAINTYMGYGETQNYKVTLFDLGDEYKAIGLTGNIAFIDVVVKYNQRVRDWLALYLKYSLASRLGTEVQSVLGHGFNTINSFELGWKIKLLEREKSILSTYFELQNHTGNFVNILGFTKDVIEGAPNPQISKKIPVLTGGVGLDYAYAFNDLFGFRCTGDITYGETYIRGKNAFRYLGGASFDVNFNKRYDVPLGIAINFTITSQPELVYVDGRFAKISTFKLAYTGSPDFSIGLEWGHYITPMEQTEKDPYAQTIGFATKYFF